MANNSRPVSKSSRSSDHQFQRRPKVAMKTVTGDLELSINAQLVFAILPRLTVHNNQTTRHHPTHRHWTDTESDTKGSSDSQTNRRRDGETDRDRRGDSSGSRAPQTERRRETRRHLHGRRPALEPRLKLPAQRQQTRVFGQRSANTVPG